MSFLCNTNQLVGKKSQPNFLHIKISFLNKKLIFSFQGKISMNAEYYVGKVKDDNVNDDDCSSDVKESKEDGFVTRKNW